MVTHGSERVKFSLKSDHKKTFLCSYHKALMKIEWKFPQKIPLRLPHPHPSPYFWPSTSPLIQISFSPQPSTAIEIKDGSHNFHKKLLSTGSPKLCLLCRLTTQLRVEFFWHLSFLSSSVPKLIIKFFFYFLKDTLSLNLIS